MNLMRLNGGLSRGGSSAAVQIARACFTRYTRNTRQQSIRYIAEKNEGYKSLEKAITVQDDRCGTEGRNRTGTPVKEPDFESGASTSSATPAHLYKATCVDPIMAVIGRPRL